MHFRVLMESDRFAYYKDPVSNRRRELLSTAFDNTLGRWVWYAHAWSDGVVVSSDERELYLAFNLLAFRQAIKGRPATEPRRPYGRTLRRLLSTILRGRDPAQKGA